MEQRQFGFEKLSVWQAARTYSKEIYKLTRQFPKEEVYGLTSQIQRAAVSISSNIAEGSGRTGVKDQLKFYAIAYGSLLETISQLFLALDLEYITKNDIDNLRPLADTISARLSILCNNLQTKINE